MVESFYTPYGPIIKEVNKIATIFCLQIVISAYLVKIVAQMVVIYIYGQQDCK